MDLLSQFIYFGNILVTLALGFIIFYKDVKDKMNLSFFLFSGSIASWLATLYFFYHDGFVEHVVLFGRLNFLFSEFLVFFLLLFVFYFPKKVFSISRILWFALLVEMVVLGSITFFTDLVAFDEIPLGNGERKTIFGAAYPLFVAHFAGYALGSVIILIYKLKNLHQQYRLQIIYFTAGLVLSILCGVSTNIIAPFVYDNFAIQQIGSITSLFVVIFTFYAVARHGFLNIKVFATQVLLTILTLFFLIPIFSKHSSLLGLSLDIILFGFVVFSGVLLLNSVQKEIKRKEELHTLASSLEKANRRLKVLDRQKTEFLSIASHQLRTPLSIIKGYGELMLDGAYGKVTKKMKGVLHDMDESNERLVKLVDEFLNITRIEQGRTKYLFEEASLNDLIDGIVKELLPKANKLGSSIVWKPGKKVDKVIMDEEKVRHIIFNFVDNGLKYGKGTPVKVTVKQEEGGFAVRVRDKGMGFGKEDEANFFHKFYRGKNVQGTNVNGTGLGIYVCKQFAEAHRGRVWGTSTGLGKGSEFGFWMPFLDPENLPKVNTENKQEEDAQHVVNQYAGDGNAPADEHMSGGDIALGDSGVSHDSDETSTDSASKK